MTERTSTKTFAQGFAAGLRRVEGKDDREKANTRIEELLFEAHTLPYLDKEGFQELTAEVYQRCFQSNSGAIFMAEVVRRVLEEPNRHRSGREDECKRWALETIANKICENLKRAHQIGHIAAGTFEIALWVAREISSSSHIVAEKLLRTCGDCLSGEQITQHFWSLYEKAEGDLNLTWALEAFAEGLAKRQRASRVMAEYFTARGEVPKLELRS